MLLTVIEAISSIAGSLTDVPPSMAVEMNQRTFDRLMNVRDVLELIVSLTLEIKPGHD